MSDTIKVHRIGYHLRYEHPCDSLLAEILNSFEKEGGQRVISVSIVESHEDRAVALIVTRERNP